MCGITGVLNITSHSPVEKTTLLQMLEIIRHRGPDGFGIYRDTHVGLGSARLSIIDLAGGDQPIGNESDTKWIVFNGEIFNYVDLRPELEARGHTFTTNTDTEVIIHLYEDFGPTCVSYLNGQFAIAIWDSEDKSLFLARDRVGIRPLFYTVKDGQLIFGSEIKSILAHPDVRAEIDLIALEQIFTFWSPQSSKSIFKGIQELPPGHFILVKDGNVKIEPYWEFDFTQETPRRSDEEYLEEFEALLVDASRIRLRADVPVGAYLSGGLDSSVTAAIIQKYTDTHLDTFSISFSDPDFDESYYQLQMADHLGTNHNVVYCTHENIGEVFPEVIWHTETPILRTAPAPMFLLSEMVQENNYKVVLTGEGADEFLAGYDIFKEALVRRFWAKNPDSKIRPLLLGRLYPDIRGFSGARNAFQMAFFKKGLTDTQSPYYSHMIRWNNTGRNLRFLANPPEHSVIDSANLAKPNPEWHPLAQAQFLEATTFLSPYLLSSQGDRMGMGHSIEGRYPFLDYRVIEFANRLPREMKLRGLTEKWILKKFGEKLVPKNIWKRYKQPYRAPILASFFPEKPLDYVCELLSSRATRKSECFNPAAVDGLVQKAQRSGNFSEAENMALVGIISTQLVYQQFVEGFQIPTGKVGRLKEVTKL